MSVEDMTPDKSIAFWLTNGGRVCVDERNISAVGDLARAGFLEVRKDMDGVSAEITASAIRELMHKARA